MGAAVDSLEVQIQTSAQKATQEVNKLTTSIGKLSNSLKIDTSGLEKIGKSIDLRVISDGVKNIQKQLSSAEKSTATSMRKVSKSIEDVRKDAQNIGKDFRIEGNFSAVEKGLQKYTNELAKAKLKESELFAKGETDTNKYRDAVVDIQKYSNMIESLNRQIEDMKPISALTEINMSGLDNAKKQLDDFIQELEDFRNDIKSNEEVFGGLENAPKGTFETEINNLKQTIGELKQLFPDATKVISEFEKELQDLESISAGLEKEPIEINVDTETLDKAESKITSKIQSLKDMFKQSGKDFYFEGNSEQLEKEIQKVNVELDKLYNRKNRMIELGKVDTEPFKGLIRDIENAKNKLDILENSRPDALNRTLEENANSLDRLTIKLKQLVVPPLREKNLEKLQSMLRKVEEEVDRLKAKLANEITMGNIKVSADDRGFQNLSAQIAIAEKRAETIRQKIQDIGGSSKSTTGLKVLSSAFQKLGVAAEKAATTIKSALKGITNIVSGAFSKLGQIGSRAAGAIKSAASSIASSFAKIGSSSKGLKTAHSNLGNLLKTALGFVTLRGIFNFAKEAVGLGSDIAEVENVVNTAFGSMAKHAYDFASTATEQFGLSELAAKQYSGTMMAMLKSSGVAQAQAAKMSTTLAGLAGDIASFYNIETDEAFYKLRAAISGETEPMKALGVNMNIVNLEAFAMSQGINKAYKEMTLAEQATLRYNYIMAKTTDAQGDFARTVDSFANQWRLLKLNIQSVSAVLGQGIIAGILPIIKALNALMGKLMQAAKVFRDFMYTLMGKKIESSTSGIVNDLAGIGDAAGSLGDLGDAAEEAGKKLKNKLFTLSFDELNILSDTSDDLKDSLSGIGDVDMGGFGDFSDIATETPVNEWAQRIRDAFLAQDWEELGKTIAELVNIGLQKVYDAIIDITPKVEQALKNFAKVFNSFVEWLDWDLLGRTIGAGVNLLVKAFNALFGDEGIDLENLGKKLSVGFRGLVDEINWVELGNALGNGFMIAWRLAEGFIEDMWRIDPNTLLTGWAEVGIAIGEAVNGIFERINFEQIARVITEGFRGILEAAANALNEIRFDDIAANINKGLEVLYNNTKWEHIGEQVTKFAKAVVDAFNDLLTIDFGLIGGIIGNGITSIVRAFNILTGEGGINFEQLGANISNGLRNLFSSIPWEEFGNALGNGFMIGWRIMDGFVTSMSQQDGAGLTGWAQLGIAIGNAINGIFEKIDFETIANVLVVGFNGVIEMLKNFIVTIEWSDIATNLTNGINTLIHGVDWENAGATLSELVVKLLGVFQQVAQETDWEGFGRGIGEFLSNIDWKTIIGQVFDILWEVFSGCITGLFDTSAGKVIIAFIAGLTALTGVFNLVDIASKALKWITLATDTLSGLKGLIFDKVIPGVASAIGHIAGEGGLFSKIVSAAKGAFSGAGILTKIGTVIFSPKGLLIAGIIAGVALIVTHWDEIKEVAKNLWENVLVPFGNFLKDVFTKIWEDYLAPALKYLSETILPKLAEIFSNLWNNVLVPLGGFIADVLGPVFEVLGKVIKWLMDNAIVPAAKALTDEFGAALDLVADLVGDLGDVLQGLIDFIVGVFTGDWERAWSGLGDIVEGIFNGIIDIAQYAINSVIRFINNGITGINNIVDSVPAVGEKIPNIPTIPEVTLPHFSTGGFPEDGLFMANHSELVGQFSNGRTAVANNEQIIAGIEEAAYRGFMRAMAEGGDTALMKEQNDLLTKIANKKMVATLDRRETLQGLREESSRQGYTLNTSYAT